MKITSGYEQDNCSSQNQNWYLFTGLGQCVNTWGPETVTIKFLEKGHTFMAADAIYGNIGKLFRKTGTVASFDDFLQLCGNGNNNIKRYFWIYPSHISFQKMHVNNTVCCTLGLIIFYLKLQKIHWIYILYLYFITYLICTNFTQSQYVLFFGVLISAQVNFCPSLKESILMRY